MSLRDVVTLSTVTSALVFNIGIAGAQPYPNKFIRVTTTEIGGGGDFAIRLLAPEIARNLGQQVVVDNRGTTAIEITAKAAPDGYTLVLFGSPLWLLPLMRDNVHWDPIKDFAPVTLAVSAPKILVIHPSLPVTSVKELIDLAKSKPGELNYSSGLAGTASHLSGELFKAMAGVNVVRIAYKGTGPALNALIGKQVQFMFTAVSPAAPHIKSGRLKALAVTSAQPSALLPELPTMAASGVPGYESVLPFALFAPAKTPPTIIAFLNKEFVRALNEPTIKERFFNSGTEVVASTPEQLAAMRTSEMKRWGKVIKEANIHDD